MTEEQPLTAEQKIAQVIHSLSSEHQTRELSLTVTKLQEAEMWLKKHREAISDLGRRAMGVQNGPTQPSI